MEITKSKYLNLKELESLNRDLELMKLRDRLAIKLLLHLGMRTSELLEILVTDVSLSEMSIQVAGKKGSKPRDMPIPGLVESDLRSHIQSLAGSKKKLFNISASGLRHVWRRVRPCAKGLHSLRHTFAIQLFKNHRDVRLVQTCLGHRSINNTMVYADYVYSKEDMQKALMGSIYATR